MDPAELAILRTVLYSDLFNYPLTRDELRRGLFDLALDAAAIERALAASDLLRGALEERDGYVFVTGRSVLVEERRAGERNARELRARHGRTLSWLSRLPFVRLVAISGAVAFGNAHDDDVDVFFVTAANRVWTVCLLVTALTRLAGARRAICANYFLDERSLDLADRDLYTAHQLVHLEPFAGIDAYRSLVGANPWAGAYLPSAYAASRDRVAPAIARGAVRRLAERLLGALLEPISRRVLAANFRKKVPADVDPASVRLGDDRLKLHINDHRATTLARFDEAVAARIAEFERLDNSRVCEARVS